MTIEPDHIDELIAKYLSGEASAEQIEAVDRWRTASDENAHYFDHLRLIFEKAGSFTETISFDTDEAWARVKKNLLTQTKVVSLQRKDSGVVWLKAAASVIAIAAAGLFGYQFLTGKETQRIEVLAGAEMRADTLPDGSNVFLNRETKIEYSFSGKDGAHIAKLSGEAYFNIQHEEAKNFVVEAGETFIRDIGTSFNVKANPASNTIEVVVEEGEVLFYTKGDPGIHLRANDKGIYDKVTGKFKISEPEANVTAYKTKNFVFDNHSLQTVVKTLNAVYGSEIRIDDKIKDCRLTVSFIDEGIGEIVQVIAETLGLSVTSEAGVTRLQGTGCGEAPSK